MKTGYNRSLHTSTPLRDDVKVVTVPPFADSISEGDVRWEKGKASVRLGRISISDCQFRFCVSEIAE